jgi:hypothetical protein
MGGLLCPAALLAAWVPQRALDEYPKSRDHGLCNIAQLAAFIRGVHN